nr:DivIVA domain-containing protein [Micromonospora halophytica]
MTRRHHAPQPPAPTNTMSAGPLRPWQVRDRCFNVRRHGLDPVEIRDFLHRVADELTVAQTALVAVQEENVRIKNALRAWQSAQSANRHYR